jgi:hypothetical protein
MRIYRNIGHIKRQRRLAKIFAVLGCATLIATFPIAFLMSGKPGLILITYVFLILGFVLFSRGMREFGRWTHSARHVREDLALDNQLSTLSDRYALIHYGEPNGKVIDHLLVHPGGVLLITTRDFPGEVFVENDRWRKGGSLFARVFTFSGPQIGNPTRDTEQFLDLTEQALNSADLETDIEAVIVFTAESVQLNIDGSSDPVLPIDELADYVRELNSDFELSNSEREAIISFLSKGEEVEEPAKASTRRPVKVKKRAAS